MLRDINIIDGFSQLQTVKSISETCTASKTRAYFARAVTIDSPYQSYREQCREAFLFLSPPPQLLSRICSSATYPTAADTKQVAGCNAKNCCS